MVAWPLYGVAKKACAKCKLGLTFRTMLYVKIFKHPILAVITDVKRHATTTRLLSFYRHAQGCREASKPVDEDL